ncbi:MAG: tRNA (N6-isopentenyl adenosine(37)-C2)-methylthiotransferase MiaB, partial [Clostridium perfringens]|nr:tRNA (N6-isopentenyl adenosine(37)-C2)-methylthiotransferase MiaB [Clostridium perfringens]
LGQLKQLKKKNPNLVIAICGCMMQQVGMADKVLKTFPYVDIIFGTHNAHKFPEYLHRVLQEGVQVKEILNKEEGIVEGLPIDRKSDVKAFVTIMYGCNNFCTYCIVPYVRGRERSRKSEDIIKEIEELVSKGYKEITLLGQNVNSYGKGLEEDIDFAGLLRKVNEVKGLERVRFMTSHPKDLSDDVIMAIKECDKLCEQVHLPVQSGSSRILKEMNRHYDREYYLDLVKKIKSEIPDVTLTTDIIIGFPGETEEDFLDTLSLCEEVGYDSAFTFIYSRRNHTPADKMENQIPDDIKHDRFNRLVEAINKKVVIKNKEYEGKVVEVLVEGPSKNDETKLTGRTRNGKLVNFAGDEKLVGELVNLKIVRAQPFSLIGEIVE